MEPESIPPPPPPQPQERGDISGRGFHLPRTNLFRGFRQQIASYEIPPSFNYDLEPLIAAIGAFILSAFFTLFISLGQVSIFSPIYTGANAWIGSVFLAPPVEETMKGLSVLAMALVIPRAFPNRRYTVAIGVAAGLGYALSEDITYFANPDVAPKGMILRLILNPLGHPVFTALCAVGIFVFVARLRSGQSISKALFGLPLLMWLVAVLNHASWNAWQYGVVPYWGYAGEALSIFVLVGPFLIILRDFLGGHFNFGRFFEPIPEPPPPPPPISAEETSPQMPTQLMKRRRMTQEVKSSRQGSEKNCEKTEREIAWTLR